MLTLHEVERHEWRAAAELRLQMLADTPIAYLESLDHAQQRSDDEWRLRHERRFTPNNRSLVVVDPAGVWRGHAGVTIEHGQPRRAWLVAVWVHPDYRGPRWRAAMQLLEAQAEWVRSQGLDELWLEVHEHNARAIAFYTRAGFKMTGDRVPYRLDPRADELVMKLDLR